MDIGTLRLKRIEVRGLFGLFDHVIDLGEVTIIHGLNGYGKTTVLRMVNFLFNGRFRGLLNIDFDKFFITFTNDLLIKVENKQKKHNDRPPRNFLVFYLFDKKDEDSTKNANKFEYDFVGNKYTPELEDFSYRLERYLPFLTRISADEWIDDRDGTKYFFDEVISQFEDNLPRRIDSLKKKWPDWLTAIVKGVDSRYIEAQRLLMEERVINEREPPARFPLSREFVRHSSRAVVVREAQHLVRLMSTKFAEYASQSQTLDRSFPNRVIETHHNVQLEPPIIKELEQIEARRVELIEVGLLNQEEAEITRPTKELHDPTIIRVLSIYISDMKKKLDLFSDLYNQIRLFISVVNERFEFKQIYINRDDGIIVKDNSGRQIPLEALSSGEQHQLVMMYELIFNTGKGDLVLIDEPELSLHIAWQKRFLPDLMQIAEMNGMYAVVATHSPQIINDRWDLTVQLSAKES